MQTRYTPYFPIILLIFHAIGIVIFTQYIGAVRLTWFNLLLCGVLVFLSERGTWSRIKTFLIIFIGGFLIELVGIKTGWLFGEYSYGSALGFRLLGVSLIIGMNWYAIVLAASNLVRKFNISIYLKALLAGLLCVLLDVIIEPVAIKYGFWNWEGDSIPLYNYITWYVFSSLFAYLYLRISLNFNPTAKWLYFIWLSFFLILTLV